MAPWLSIHSPTTKWGEGGGASHQRGDAFPMPAGRLYGFRRQRRYKKWRQRRRTSPVGTASQPIGKPFNGQAKGQLRPTCTSYAGCAHQPSGILESTAQVPVPNAPQAPEPSRPYGRVPQSFAAALAFRQSSTSCLPKSPCSCSNLATTGAVASCQRWISSFGIT